MTPGCPWIFSSNSTNATWTISDRYGAKCSTLPPLIITCPWSSTAPEARIALESVQPCCLRPLACRRRAIIEDHDLSNVYNAERLQPIYAKFAAIGIGPKKAAPYLQAPIEPLIAMFDHLKNNYGTIEELPADKSRARADNAHGFAGRSPAMKNLSNVTSKSGKKTAQA